ncbi:MAG: SIR2 family protein [Pseudomonadota bacterium]
MRIPHSLEVALSQRKVIPFVGAGLSQGILDRTGKRIFPNWPNLLDGAATRLEAEGKEPEARLVSSLVETGDLLGAAKSAKENLSQPIWVDYLKEVFDRTFDDVDPESLSVLRMVWALGSNLVVTTNYDRSLQWTCPDRADFRVWDIEAKAEQVETIRQGNAPRPTVWHLHGQIDNANKIILAPEQYGHLYGDGVSKEIYSAALATLRTILKSHTLLFVGFSMTDAKFMAQVIGVNEEYDGTAGRHFALLKNGEADKDALRAAGVEPIWYETHDQVGDLLTGMSMQTLKSLSTHVQAGRYIVDRNEGLYLFGGRGDAFFQLYDEALLGIQNQLDIFSLKLSRFRKQHTATLLAAAARTRIRIALLDPAFPLPEDHISVAALREQEEHSPVGAIRRDVAEWADVYGDYCKAIDDGAMTETPENGLDIRLYNILPTINLFRVDANLFVGPYLLDVEDRETPTFLIKSEAPGHGSMGNTMFNVYQRHFEAMWENPGTRTIQSVPDEELECWRQGTGC